MRRRMLLLVSAALMAVGVAQAQTPTPSPTSPQTMTPGPRVRGTIKSLSGQTLVVTTNAGDTVTVMLAPNFAVAAVLPTTLDAIKPGVMVGIVGFGPPTQQRAAVIAIFPPNAGVAESQFAWDSQPDSVMTNAPVVSQVAATSAHELTVTVKGQEVHVTVPPNCIIQTTEPGTAAMLTPGAHVWIGTQKTPGGELVAARVNVGKDGFTPAN